MHCLKIGHVDGCVAAPPSKSMFGRAVAAAVLSSAPCTIISKSSLCDDALFALKAACALGMNFSQTVTKITLKPSGHSACRDIPCGESGLSLRMFTAIASLSAMEHRLVSTGSLSTRPVDMVQQPLIALGASCSTNSGLPPIVIKGPIRGGLVDVDGSISSQFVTGLLLALPFCKKDSTVRVHSLKSKPYVLMTVELLKELGITLYHNKNLTHFYVPGDQQIEPFTYEVEGDWSAAAFLLVAGAIGGSVTITGLRPNSLQPDKSILTALENAGANVAISKNKITVIANKLKSFEFDATQCPDLFPPLAALASACAGVSKISGVHRLAAKESDRAAALQQMLKSLGYNISINDDAMLITGGISKGGTVDPMGDHRIAMAGAVITCNANGPIYINNPNCVNKSYPDFFTDLRAIGVEIL